MPDAQRMCHSKRYFLTEEKALKTAVRVVQLGLIGEARAYQCPICHGFHLTSQIVEETMQDLSLEAIDQAVFQAVEKGATSFTRINQSTREILGVGKLEMHFVDRSLHKLLRAGRLRYDARLNSWFVETRCAE